jgi:hypothetical protein
MSDLSGLVEEPMYLIMIAAWGIALFLGALLHRYITDKRKARRQPPPQSILNSASVPRQLFFHRTCDCAR